MIMYEIYMVQYSGLLNIQQSIRSRAARTMLCALFIKSHNIAYAMMKVRTRGATDRH